MSAPSKAYRFFLSTYITQNQIGVGQVPSLHPILILRPWSEGFNGSIDPVTISEAELIQNHSVLLTNSMLTTGVDNIEIDLGQNALTFTEFANPTVKHVEVFIGGFLNEAITNAQKFEEFYVGTYTYTQALSLPPNSTYSVNKISLETLTDFRPS